MIDNDERVIKLNNVSKQFGGIFALKNVDFELKKEIHSIVGHNGAGKSTLMKIIIGAYQPDEGEVLLNGKCANFSSPREAQNAGISMVWQELSNFPNLTITENILMHRYIRNKIGGIDWRANHELCREYLHRIDLDIDPQKKVREFPLAQQQLVEFAKALSYSPSLMILDEPTSALSLIEQEILYKKVWMIKEQGVAVIFISHKLDEVMLLSDRITVMRDGQRIFTKQKDEVKKDEIIDAIVGRNIKDKHGADSIKYDARKYNKSTQKLLKIKNLEIERKLSNVSFDLKKGEILGLVGVSGSGISEIGKILTGLEHEYQGEMYLNGNFYKPTRPQDAVRNRIGYVPKNRKDEGIIPNMSAEDNITLSSLKELSRFSFINRKKAKKHALEAMDIVDIIPRDAALAIGLYSGGNQQKAVIARSICNRSSILILDEPTRGVDVGAIHKIYSLIRNMADEGLSVIIISSDFEEVCDVVDRVLVFNKGVIVGEIESKDLAWKDVLALAVK